MGIIRVEEAQAGMVLGAEVRDRMGRLLMNAGQEITGRALRVFRMWGVAEIDVEGHAGATPAGAVEEIAPADLERLQAVADGLFRHADRSHPAMAELLRLSIHRMARRDSA